MPGHVAVGRAEGHQGEVEALHQEELRNVDGTNLNVSIVRVDIQQPDRTRKKIFFMAFLTNGDIRSRTYIK